MPCRSAALRIAGARRSGRWNDSGVMRESAPAYVRWSAAWCTGGVAGRGANRPGDGDDGAGELRADGRRVAGGVPGAVGVVALRDRVGQAVDPLRAVAPRVPGEGGGRVGEPEAGGRGLGGRGGVEQVGGGVELRLLAGAEPGEGVAVLAVEDARVADHHDHRARRPGADRGVQRGQLGGRGVADVALRAVDRAVAVGGPRRQRARRQHVGEPRVVAADRDAHVARGARQRRQLGVGHVGDAGARAGAEVQRVPARRRDQGRIGVRRALAARAVGEVGAGAGARGVRVAEGDIGQRDGRREPPGPEAARRGA